MDNELVIVQTRAILEGFYAKLGWIAADSTDVDLSEWGGKGRGYGVHRNPQMLRYPKMKEDCARLPLQYQLNTTAATDQLQRNSASDTNM